MKLKDITDWKITIHGEEDEEIIINGNAPFVEMRDTLMEKVGLSAAAAKEVLFNMINPEVAERSYTEDELATINQKHLVEDEG